MYFVHKFIIQRIMNMVSALFFRMSSRRIDWLDKRRVSLKCR